MTRLHNGVEHEGNVKLIHCAGLCCEGENVIAVHDIALIIQYCDVRNVNITSRSSYLTDKS